MKPAAGQLESFTQAVLGSQAVIAIVRDADGIVSASVTDTPEDDARALGEAETLELRYWDGRPWNKGDPIMKFD